MEFSPFAWIGSPCVFSVPRPCATCTPAPRVCVELLRRFYTGRSGQISTSWRREKWHKGAPSSASSGGAIVLLSIAASAGSSGHGGGWVSARGGRPPPTAEGEERPGQKHSRDP